MNQDVTIILFVFFTGCFVAACVWLTLWMGRGMKTGAQDAARAAAGHLELKPKPSGSAGMESGVYEGTVDGILIIVTAASRTMMIGSPQVCSLSIGQVTVTALLPAALPYSLHIDRSANPPGPVIRVGDELFDRAVRVSTNDERAARTLLSSEILRNTIQGFVREGSEGHAIITERSIIKNLFDTHLNGESSVIQAVQDVVAVAKVIARVEGGKPPPVRDLLKDISRRLRSKLSDFKDLKINIAGPVVPGISLRDAHHFPRDKDISSYETPCGFLRRADEEKTPEGLSRVEVDCDTGVFRDRRNEWYQFDGYFLSLLVFTENGEIWDARWEHTDY